MSIESMTIALHHSKAKGAEKLVLIGIANHDGDGGAWPSMATLAKYAGVSRDQARKLVIRLENRREIRRLVNGGGLYDLPEYLRPNRYQFLLRCPNDCDHSSQHRTNVDRDAVTFLETLEPEPEVIPESYAALQAAIAPPSRTEGGQPHGGGAPSRTEGQTVHKPSIETSREETRLIAREAGADLVTGEVPDEPPADPCPRRPKSPHAYSRKTHLCIDCGKEDPNA